MPDVLITFKKYSHGTKLGFPETLSGVYEATTQPVQNKLNSFRWLLCKHILWLKMAIMYITDNCAKWHNPSLQQTEGWMFLVEAFTPTDPHVDFWESIHGNYTDHGHSFLDKRSSLWLLLQKGGVQEDGKGGHSMERSALRESSGTSWWRAVC